MKKPLFLFLFIYLGTVFFAAQKKADLSKNKANSLIYEQPDEAIAIASKLLTTEKKVDDMADLYMIISNAYIAKKNNDSSFFYNLKAKNLIAKTNLTSTKLKILNSVAVQYQQMELYEEALKILDEAQVTTDKLSDKIPLFFYNTAFINNTRGIIYRNQANSNLALQKLKMAVENFKKLPLDKKNAANLSIAYHNMASCYLDLSQLQQALTYFAEAKNYAQKYDDAILIAYNLKGEGEVFFLTNQHSEALKALYLAEKRADPFSDLVLNSEIYNLLANTNLAINNIQQFQYYNQKYAQILKILENDELKSFNRYANAQDLDQKAIAEKIKKQFNLYNWLTIILTIFLVGFLIKKILNLRKNNYRRKRIIENLSIFEKVE